MRFAALVAALILPVMAMLPMPVASLAAVAVDATPQVHTVLIEGMRFQPKGLTVAAGDTVVWINRDMVPHTATSASGHRRRWKRSTRPACSL